MEIGNLIKVQVALVVLLVLATGTFLVAADKEPTAATGPAVKEAPVDDANPLTELVGKKDMAQLLSSEKDQQGCRIVKFPSGTGVIADGRGVYTVDSNPTATRIRKQLAYQMALMDAKKNLATFLKGLAVEHAHDSKWVQDSVVTGQRDLSNRTSSDSQITREFVSGCLRGYVVFETSDDGKGTVKVSLVSTPKTRLSITRPSDDIVISGTTLADGLRAVMSEVKMGPCPILGAKVVIVPGTKETAVIGFGSAVIRSSDDPELQSGARLAATRMAEARAKAMLGETLKGATNSWTLEGTETTDASAQEFEEITSERSAVNAEKRIRVNSPLRGKPAATTKPGDGSSVEDLFAPSTESVQQLDQVHKFFRNRFKVSESGSSRGDYKLPPGLLTVSWISSDGGFAHAAVLYSTKIRDMARTADAEMQAGAPTETEDKSVRPHRSESPDEQKPADDHQDQPDLRPSKSVGPLPSGRVTQDKDL